jgi:hypothetical protein
VQLYGKVVGNYLEQDHCKQSQANIERVFPFLKVGHEYGTYNAQVAQDQVKNNGDDNGEYKDGQNISALHFQRTVFRGNKEIGKGTCKGYKKRV